MNADEWTQVVPTALRPLLDRVFDQAALLGSFRPLELVGEMADRGTLRLVLGALGAVSKEMPGSIPVWQLEPDARRTRLRDLARRAALDEAAASVQPDPDDQLGRFLVAAARGESIEAGDLTVRELGVLHTALGFAAEFGPADRQTQAVEAALARRDFEESLDFLLPPRFVGRRTAIARLRRFATEPTASPEAKIPIAILSGVGGSGKSALLAETVRREHRGGASEIPVIWLDFDRASLASADTAQLTVEFSRQLVRWRPDLAEPLAEFRRMAQIITGEPDAPAHFESIASSRSELWSMWQSAMWHHLPLKAPLLLVLDTFEEMLLREELELEQVLLWLAALRQEGAVTGLRPVLSGRGMPKFLDLPSHFAEAERIDLEDLTAREAPELLKDHLTRLGAEVSAFPVPKLAERFGGNPLVMRLLARYCAEHGPTAARELLADGDRNGFGRDFAQAFLYSRILKRIRTDDPAVKRLAHPGLVLRRITPDLIQHVLAKPCQLGDVDRARATRLFDALSQQVWLVEPVTGQSAVRHRRDLRRLMLTAMLHEPDDVLRAIHQRAHEYYQEGRDPWLSPAEQGREALYHFYMTGGRERLTSPEAAAFLLAIGQDIDDLPLRARAPIKLRGGRSLTQDEAAALDRDLSSLYTTERLKIRVSRGSIRSAPVAKGRARAEPMPAAIPAAIERELAPHIEAHLAKGSFAWLRDAFEPAWDEFHQLLGERNGATTLPADLTQLPLWRVTMVSLAQPDFTRTLAKRLRGLDLRNWSVPMVRGRRYSAAAAVSALAGLLGAEPSDDMPPTRLLRQGRLRCTDELRLLQLAGPELLRGQTTLLVNPALLSYGAAPESAARAPTWPEKWTERVGRFFKEAGAGRPVTLADLRRFRGNDSPVPVSVAAGDRGLSPLLRGMTPEIYPPLRALLERQGGLDVAEDLAGRYAHWPLELRPQTLKTSLRRDSQRWLATLIEGADRFGELDRLVERAARDSDSGRQLLAIWRAYDTRLWRFIQP